MVIFHSYVNISQRVKCIFSLTSYVFWWFDCILVFFLWIAWITILKTNNLWIDILTNKHGFVCQLVLGHHCQPRTMPFLGLNMGEYCTTKCQQRGSSMLFKPSKNEKIWRFKMKFPQHWRFFELLGRHGTNVSPILEPFPTAFDLLLLLQINGLETVSRCLMSGIFSSESCLETVEYSRGTCLESYWSYLDWSYLDILVVVVEQNQTCPRYDHSDSLFVCLFFLVRLANC